jgi:hypothetical protein
MSFGLSHAMVDCRIARLRAQATRSHVADTRTVWPAKRRRTASIDLRNRISLTLVELGLHVMVRGASRPDQSRLRRSRLRRCCSGDAAQAFFSSSRAMTTRCTWLVPS